MGHRIPIDDGEGIVFSINCIGHTVQGILDLIRVVYFIAIIKSLIDAVYENLCIIFCEISLICVFFIYRKVLGIVDCKTLCGIDRQRIIVQYGIIIDCGIWQIFTGYASGFRHKFCFCFSGFKGFFLRRNISRRIGRVCSICLIGCRNGCLTQGFYRIWIFFVTSGNG